MSTLPCPGYVKEKLRDFSSLHSSRLKPSLCIEALESCRFSSLLVLEELHRGSCDSLFQLYFYWKLENILHCHLSHLPAANGPRQNLQQLGRLEGGSEQHRLCGAPGTLGATRPAESLLGFLPEKLPEKLHPCTGSRIKQKIFTLQFSKQSQQNYSGALVHWELCMLLIPWEAGFGYPTRTAWGPKPRCSSALGLGHSVSSK